MDKIAKLEARFLAKVEKTSGCWLWDGYRNKNGYGTFYFQGRTVWAHRMSYALFVGVIPTGFCVCHRCDVRFCVRPEHLFVGTHKENMQDCLAKGRACPPSGEDHHSAKLTKSQVADIRLEYSLGLSTQAEIGARYGVSRQQVSLVVNNRVWVK